MAHLTALNPDGITGKTKELFDIVKSKMGMVIYQLCEYYSRYRNRLSKAGPNK